MSHEFQLHCAYLLPDANPRIRPRCKPATQVEPAFLLFLLPTRGRCSSSRLVSCTLLKGGSIITILRNCSFKGQTAEKNGENLDGSWNSCSSGKQLLSSGDPHQLTYYLACILTFHLAFRVESYLTYILAFYLTYVLARLWKYILAF